MGEHWGALGRTEGALGSTGEQSGSTKHHENSPCPEVYGNHPMWDVHLHGAAPVWGTADNGAPGGLLGAEGSLWGLGGTR